MISVAVARRVALAMPEAEERQHHGHPDFRVRNKIFMTLWPAEARAVVKLAPPDQAALVAMDPAAFTLNAWSHQGWTNVHLPNVTRASFAAVVRSAWRTVAPQTLVAPAARRRRQR
jgi:hypothetical protein